MNAEKEIDRREKRIANDKKIIEELKDEISSLRQLLDCAAANIVILVRDGGAMRKISRKEVSEALGKYRLSARCDGEGNYILETKREPDN